MANKYILLLLLMSSVLKAEDRISKIIDKTLIYQDSCRYRAIDYSEDCEYYDFSTMQKGNVRPSKSLFKYQLGFINGNLARIDLAGLDNRPISSYEIFSYDDSTKIMIPFSYHLISDTLKRTIEFGFLINYNGKLTYWMPNNRQQVGDGFYARGGNINCINDVAAIITLNENLMPKKYLRFEFGKLIFMSTIKKILKKNIVHSVFTPHFSQLYLDSDTNIDSCYTFFKREYQFFKNVKSKSDMGLKYKIYFPKNFLKSFNIE